jgi:dTDP-4-dehydrorhamnose reductase
MKILLFGKHGQIGSELQRALAPLGELVALGRRDAGPAADLADTAAIARTIRAERPDVIVNAAGFTDVDRAEHEPELARRLNAEAPAMMARESAALGAWLVHYSSDYVFDGSGSAPWTEDSPMAPLNVYGQTKLESDHAIRASGCLHLVLRTSWIHGATGENFAAAMLRLARQRAALCVVDDQVGAPTSAALLASVTALSLRAAFGDASLSGTYHVAAAGATSRWAYARRVIQRARHAGVPLALAQGAIEAIPSSRFPTPARRPLNSRLDTAKLRRSFGLTLPPWEEGVDALVDRLIADPAESARP